MNEAKIEMATDATPAAKRANPFARLLDAAQRRFGRARAGSVLIMVVALLVLLALIGTAALSTVRTDRYSSAQHVANTQIDMLAEGLKQLVIARLSEDVFAGGGNQTDSQSAPGHMSRLTRDASLAARVPERRMAYAVGVPASPTGPAAGGEFVWPAISFPPIQDGDADAHPFRMDIPTETLTDV